MNVTAGCFMELYHRNQNPTPNLTNADSGTKDAHSALSLHSFSNEKVGGATAKGSGFFLW